MPAALKPSVRGAQGDAGLPQFVAASSDSPVLTERASGQRDGDRLERAQECGNCHKARQRFMALRRVTNKRERMRDMKLQGKTAKRLTLRLDAEQARIVEAVAAQLQLTPAEVMRGAIYTLSDRLPNGWVERINSPPPELLEALRALRLEVNAIGVNVNQAVRQLHLNEDNELTASMEEIGGYLGELETGVKSRVNHDS